MFPPVIRESNCYSIALSKGEVGTAPPIVLLSNPWKTKLFYTLLGSKAICAISVLFLGIIMLLFCYEKDGKILRSLDIIWFITIGMSKVDLAMRGFDCIAPT